MGVFYFGSVIRKGQLDQARDRVREVCHQDPKRIAALLRALAKVPVVTNAQIADATARLEQLAQMVGLILSGLSIPAGLYETYPSNRLAAERAKLTHPMIHRALRIIEQQHAKPLTLDVIASQLRCHPGYLSRLFREQVGKPVSDYLRQTRIDRACRLLRLGQMDVTAVGMEVGFEDKSNFGRAFRHVMHMSPGQFRQQAIGQ
jgi:AraC-like DNA-binding protein